MEKLTRTFESREAPKEEAYFSVSNLVRHCKVLHEDGREEVFSIAILGGKTKDGKDRFQAVGGGAKLTDEAIAQLKAEYPEIRFRGGEEADDARFYIPVPSKVDEDDDVKNVFIHGVMDRFNDPDADLYKGDVSREIVEELTEAKGGLPAPLTDADVARMQVAYEGALSPIQWSSTTSGRAGSSAHYLRTFHLYDITVPEDVFDKLRASQRMRVLSPEDESAIRASTEAGEVAATLPGGGVAVENIFPDL